MTDWKRLLQVTGARRQELKARAKALGTTSRLDQQGRPSVMVLEGADWQRKEIDRLVREFDEGGQGK